jgi:hypothetical protein
MVQCKLKPEQNTSTRFFFLNFFSEDNMAVAGNMVWAFQVRMFEVDGNKYLQTSQRSYYPKDKVMEPEEVVEALQKEPDNTFWCSLFGTNTTKVRSLWVDRDKTKDQKPI